MGYCLCGASETPREWPDIMGDGPTVDGVGVMERTGWGEERPSGIKALGTAEFGVLETAVEALEADKRLAVDADMGVYGEAREKGEFSVILADFGGTSGGVLPDRRREPDSF